VLFRSIQSLAGHIKPESDQSGAVVVVGGRFVCIDVFNTPSLFSDFLPILAESYAMDALLHIGRPGSWDFISRLPHILQEQLHQADELKKASLLKEERKYLFKISVMKESSISRADSEIINFSSLDLLPTL
jgi:hypothetical protein